jgi:hypothetical protein
MSDVYSVNGVVFTTNSASLNLSDDDDDADAMVVSPRRHAVRVAMMNARPSVGVCRRRRLVVTK